MRTTAHAPDLGLSSEMGHPPNSELGQLLHIELINAARRLGEVRDNSQTSEPRDASLKSRPWLGRNTRYISWLAHQRSAR